MAYPHDWPHDARSAGPKLTRELMKRFPRNVIICISPEEFVRMLADPEVELPIEAHTAKPPKNGRARAVAEPEREDVARPGHH